MIWVDTKEWGRVEAASLEELMKDLAMKVIVYGPISVICGSGDLGNPLELGKKIELARREYGATDI